MSDTTNPIFKDNTKLDRIWLDSNIHKRSSYCNPDLGTWMNLKDAQELFAQGKDVERIVKALKLHCIKNKTAYYDENGEFCLTELEDTYIIEELDKTIDQLRAQKSHAEYQIRLCETRIKDIEYKNLSSDQSE